MTKIEKIYEKERIEYANERVRSTITEIANRMLSLEMDIVDIMKVTGLTEQEILSLQDDKTIN